MSPNYLLRNMLTKSIACDFIASFHLPIVISKENNTHIIHVPSKHIDENRSIDKYEHLIVVIID